MVGLYGLVLYFPEDGTPVPKHVGVLIIVISCILLSAFVGGCIDCKYMHSTDNINRSIISSRNSKTFIETEVSLQYIKKSAICPYPETQ